MSIDDEISAIVAQLSDHQKEELRVLFPTIQQAPTRKYTKDLKEEELTETCEVEVICRVCGTTSITKHRSCSPAKSTMFVSNCSSCKSVLLTKSVPELVNMILPSEDLYISESTVDDKE